MDQTCMTIHNLGPEANILFASESITDIFGYQPSEVHGKSAFDYFHPEEVPFARSIHSRGIRLDKAAVLHYARILNHDGCWVGCECCFTIVHDVLVACTSIYRRNAKSERRAIEAPKIRRLFACSPRDPRYHMLEHLSPKFKMPPMEREPRAALILNRFTRNLTIMFATASISTIVGLSPNELKGKSFYRCIQESCLAEAIKCLESAKANDSIAYLRFCFQSPSDDDDAADDMNDHGQENHADEDEAMTDDGDDRRSKRPRVEEPGAGLGSLPAFAGSSAQRGGSVPIKLEDDDHQQLPLPTLPNASHAPAAQSPAAVPPMPVSMELEAVVSCTSDGLVVVLRKARPPIPPAHPPLVSFDYGDGLFAAPWGQHPVRPHFSQEYLHSFEPPLLPQYMPLRDNVKDAGGPPIDALMGSIRDVAVFAWGVVGINPAMAAYGRGLPSGDARPASGPRQGHRPDTHAAAAGGATGHTNTHHTATTPAGSLPLYSTKLDKGKACATSSFTSAAQPTEMPYTARGLMPSVGYDSVVVPPPGSARAQKHERSWSRPDCAPPRHPDVNMYGVQPRLPSPVSPGLSMPVPPQLPLPSLSHNLGYRPAGLISPTIHSLQPSAGAYDDRSYAWHI